MVSVLEAPAGQFITKVAEKLKNEPSMKPPQWLAYAKSGAHAERKPESKEFWYIRSASILRKAYLNGTIGVGKLRGWYGGRKCYGTSPEHHVKAGGKIIREAMKQLEAAGLLKKEKIGRKITPKGKSLLDKTAMEFYAGERRGRVRTEEPAVSAKAPRARKPKAKGDAPVEAARPKVKRKAVEHKAGEPDTGAKS